MEIAKVIDEVNIYVEKIPINEQSQYMSDNGDFKSASDGNGLSATSFSVNPQNSKNIKNRTTIGTSTGYSFLIYINKSASLRSRDYAKALNTQNDCVIYKKVANDTQIPITRIQTVSPVLSGYYKLTYQFNASPFQYVSEPISAAYNTNPFDTLNKIPTLTNKIQIFLQNKGEDEILYYIKIVDRLKNLTIDSFSFTPITSQSSSSSNTSNVITTLKGGTDGIETPITTIQDWPIATGSDIPFTNVFNSDVRPNEFIFPLTADFLAVKVFKPALKIFNNGVEAVCLFDNVTGLNECEISYLTNCPKVNDYYYDTATKLVYIWEHSQAVNDCNVGNTTSKLIGFLYDNKTRIATLSFDSDYYYIPDNTTIYFLNLVTLSRDMLCTYIASASDKRSLTCKLENLVVGKYYPLLLTPFGYVNSVNFSTAIPKIEPTIIEFEPIQNIQENTDQDLNTCIIAAKGTTNVVISGSNFPILSTACVDGKCPLDNLIVTFGGYRCFAKSSSLTTISCDITPDTLVTSTTPTENFTVKYNDVSVVDQKKSCVWSATDVKDNNTQLQYILEISLGVSLPAATIILVILLWFFCYHKKRLKREEQARLQELEDAKKSGGNIYFYIYIKT